MRSRETARAHTQSDKEARCTCPLQNHTSPKVTSFSTALSPPAAEAVTVNVPPAGFGVSKTFQLPSAAAEVSKVSDDASASDQVR